MSEVLEPRVSSFSQDVDNRHTSASNILVRVGKGVSALAFGTAVRGVGQIIIVPVALYAWGELQYGEWVLLTGLASLLGLADLGLQSFVVNRLCASHVRGDQEEMCRVLHSALRVQYPLIGALLMTIGVTLFFIPVDHVLGLRTISGSTLFAVVLLLSLEVLISIPLIVVSGLYRATGRLARGAILWGVQQIGTIGLTIVLISAKGSFLSLAVTRAVITLMLAAWVIYDLRRFYPWLRIWPTSGTQREGLDMVGPGLLFLFITMADPLSSQFMLLVIQKMLDAGEVSRFATHRLLMTGAQVASALLMYSMWPELSALHARSENEPLRRVHRSLAKLNLWLVGGITFGLLPLLPWAYSLWTAGRLVLDEWTLAFLMIRTLMWAVWNSSLTLLLATNDHRRLMPILLGATALAGVFSIIFVPVMGISGAALATLLGDACVTARLVPALASRSVGDHTRDFFSVIARALLLGIGPPIVLGLVGWHVFHSPLLRYLAIFPACATVTLFLTWRQLAITERRLAMDWYRRTFTNG